MLQISLQLTIKDGWFGKTGYYNKSLSEGILLQIGGHEDGLHNAGIKTTFNFYYQFLLQACCMLQLLKYVQKMLDKNLPVGDELSFLFAGELNPVAPKAQRKVPVPEG